MQIANMTGLIRMWCIGVSYGGRFDKDARHLVGVVVGESYGKDVGFVLYCLKGCLGVYLAVARRIKLHR